MLHQHRKLLTAADVSHTNTCLVLQQGYDVRIRTALGGGGGGECLRNLRHQFLTLNMTGSRCPLCLCTMSYALFTVRVHYLQVGGC